MNRFRNTIFVRLIAAGTAALLLVLLFRVTLPQDTLPQGDMQPEIPITIGTTKLFVTIADTEIAREQGLSGVSRLEADKGMLFVFDTQGIYSFWMKDMRFSLDMIWINAKGVIVAIDRDISPKTYPKTFTPPVPARYVLEVNAGFSTAHNLTIGDAMDVVF